MTTNKKTSAAAVEAPKNIEQFAELLRRHLDPKFEIAAGASLKGVLKLVIGRRKIADTIVIKENGESEGLIIFSTESEKVVTALFASGIVQVWEFGDAGCLAIFEKENELSRAFDKAMSVIPDAKRTK
jgi:hypothetical protein